MRTFLIFVALLLYPGIFLILWGDANYGYEWGDAYYKPIMIISCIWTFFLFYQVFRVLRWLWRHLERFLLRLFQLLFDWICRLYYYCRARADRRGNED